MSGLREQATKDVKSILEDTEFGFGMECGVKDPSGKTDTLKVQSGDIHMLLETDTGVPVNNRVAHVSIAIESLTEKGFALPDVQPKESENIWEFTFKDANGVERRFAILVPVLADRTLGVITIILGLLKDAS